MCGLPIIFLSRKFIYKITSFCKDHSRQTILSPNLLDTGELVLVSILFTRILITLLKRISNLLFLFWDQGTVCLLSRQMFFWKERLKNIMRKLPGMKRELPISPKIIHGPMAFPVT